MHRGHDNLGMLKHFPYRWCNKCGIMYLRNEATLKALRAPCPGDEEDTPKKKVK